MGVDLTCQGDFLNVQERHRRLYITKEKTGTELSQINITHKIVPESHRGLH